MISAIDITDDVLREVALTRDEYDLIVRLLGRPPNAVELGMFGAMWSEHCGYKNSRPLLKLFPTTGPRVLQGPGENAGAVDIGDRQALVLKIESHNHPSAVEPYQGAATGVGGIIRDIFTMGARPIALLDSLRFGPPDEPRNRYIVGGVVGGVAGYGNCIGIPTVGGETVFHPCYTGNPLVNAMCVGVIDREDLTRATSGEPGNFVVLVGAATGRDGVHGATFASVELSAESEERRSAVQVGDPFTEKLLMEACIQLCREGSVVGMQDLGAAGLTSSSVEIAAHGGRGIDIDLALAPRRATGMTPYEMMLSESQERMLVVVARERLDHVLGVFARWELPAVTIGRVTGDGIVRVRDGAEVVAEVPATLFTDACPVYRREGREDPRVVEARERDLSILPEPDDYGEALLALLRDPSIASKKVIWRRYDHTIGANTVIGPGHDAALLRLKNTSKAVALTTDCNARLCYLDPYVGGAAAVAEAALNIAVTGATPLCVTDCLNFGNPERPAVYYQLERSAQGMSDACSALGTPVVSGNVSLYNESATGAIYPTPVVGMAGLLDDVAHRVDAPFAADGDVVFLLGSAEVSLGGSAHLAVRHGLDAGRPAAPDLDLCARLVRLLSVLAAGGLLRSAHDCAEGGLAVALAECSIWSGRGARITLPDADPSPSLALFGEGSGRVIASCAPTVYARVEVAAREAGVPLARLGAVGGDTLYLTSATATATVRLPVSSLRDAYEGGLPAALMLDS
jgi:phosphoribosylformylglycinamidine synthase II